MLARATLPSPTLWSSQKGLSTNVRATATKRRAPTRRLVAGRTPTILTPPTPPSAMRTASQASQPTHRATTSHTNLRRRPRLPAHSPQAVQALMHMERSLTRRRRGSLRLTHTERISHVSAARCSMQTRMLLYEHPLQAVRLAPPHRRAAVLLHLVTRLTASTDERHATGQNVDGDRGGRTLCSCCVVRIPLALMVV